MALLNFDINVSTRKIISFREDIYNVQNDTSKIHWVFCKSQLLMSFLEINSNTNFCLPNAALIFCRDTQ